MLRASVATVLTALCLSGSPAQSDDIPTLDVNPVCRGIAQQGELEVGLQQTSFQECVKSEQEVREQIKKEWSTFSASDKSHCVALAKTGGESSYTELITCMEMARDVRKLHADQQKGSDTSVRTRPRGAPGTRGSSPANGAIIVSLPDPRGANAADRSRKSIFTSIAQAGDRRPQAGPEPSPYTFDARTLLPKVGAALFAERPANLSELSKRL
jgi:hypothetical protein